MNTDLRFQIALTLVPHIGPVQAKILLQQFEVAEIFRAKASTLEKLDGIGTIRAAAIKSFREFDIVDEEIAFLEKYQVQPIFINDAGYPQRLLACYDSPTLLYYKGSADLNASRILSVIGTRKNTEYGKQLTERLISDLAAEAVTIVSGLAFGIDATAHRVALRSQLPTIGVLAHGLDQVYPVQHSHLAKEITASGGLLTEFRRKTNPDKHNFPSRNRVVAGMADATIVIETGSKGGSMITAELANGYNKDVFAFPGRTTDNKSRGCNDLIRTNKAILTTGAADLLDMLGWDNSKTKPVTPQRQLFIELSAEEKIIVDIIRIKESVHIDEINFRSGLSASTVAAAILNLELQHVIHSAPGKLYRLN